MPLLFKLKDYLKMKSITNLVIILLLQISANLFANEYISGKVIDEQNNAVPYAAISIYNSEDSVFVKGSTTDIDGIFEISLKKGSYYCKVTYLSYEDYFIPNINVENKAIDLGVIKLSIADQFLDEVEIQAERSQMVLQLDKKVFNVGKDLSTIGANGADILDKVPSVNVDLEGNITLRGSGNVRILINGKPSGLVNAGDPESLRQLQGNLIESIEVITNPSAKYDAEGEVGIINIVLKKQIKKGLNGSFDLKVGYPHNHSAAANLNYRSEKVNFFISEGFSYQKNPGGGSSTQRYLENNALDYAFDRTYKHTREDYANNLRLGVNVYPSQNDVITIAGMYRYSGGKNLSTTRYTDYNNLEVQTGIVERYQDENETEHNVEFDINYEREFKKDNQKLSVDFKYGLSNDTEKAFYDEDSLENAISLDARQRSNNLEYQKNFLAQVDYQHPFRKKGLIGTGFKANVRNFENDFIVEDQQQDESWQILDRFNNNLIYKENIYALYLILGDEIKNFSYKAGLRTELSDISTELIKTNETNPRLYIDFFPSIFLGYKVNEKNTLQLSYSRRITRPNFWSLVPFYQYADVRNYWSGNPNLNPEYAHLVEFGYQRYLKKGSFLGSIYYRRNIEIIEWITFVEPSGLTRGTPVNLGTGNSYGIDLSFNTDFTDWWSFNANFNGYHTKSKGSYEGVTYNNEALAADIKVSSKFKIIEPLDFQISYNFNSPRNRSQGKIKSQQGLDFGLSFQTFKKKGKFTLSVTDVFNTRIRRWETVGDDFSIDGSFQWRQARTVVLSFNYQLDKRK